jgi:hypothetical protein
MTIRRSVAALLAAFVVLVGGGTLTACGPVDGNIGTSANNPKNRSGNDPGGVSQGNLPNLSDRIPENSRESGRTVGNG